ncbi:hypothetical protein [Frankia sp. QA3]|uniref:hypothetical protein n=1 Tax=Frankia sp. QA3 TaxID=710111 RepID=UPI0002E48336|nr:hypothetical protein [Frankia sp. QA3]
MSGWLNAGVPVTQVAEWAGHSVRVCLLVYAKCIAGQDEAARRRIDAALAAEDGITDVTSAAQPARSGPRTGHGEPDTTGPDRMPPDSSSHPAEDMPAPELGL